MWGTPVEPRSGRKKRKKNTRTEGPHGPLGRLPRASSAFGRLPNPPRARLPRGHGHQRRRLRGLLAGGARWTQRFDPSKRRGEEIGRRKKMPSWWNDPQGGENKKCGGHCVFCFFFSVFFPPPLPGLGLRGIYITTGHIFLILLGTNTCQWRCRVRPCPFKSPGTKKSAQARNAWHREASALHRDALLADAGSRAGA